jgi:hypothetical protein
VPRPNPLVFISHDSRDADLAEAFDHLLTDASGGVIRTFRSSDQTGKAGIEYGEDWYSKITRMLGEASDVVALMTRNSIGRPWILFEAGFAVGRLDTRVFGIALGVPLLKATSGPFARFQNCEAKEDPVTTVVLELIQRNPNARPRAEAVRRQVQAFLAEIEPLLKKRAGSGDETPEEMDATAAARLFEEVKVMFRDLPTLVESYLKDQGLTRRRRRFHPMMFEDILHIAQSESAGDPAVSWLIVASQLREELPWIADAAMELYRAMRSGSASAIENAQQDLLSVSRIMSRSRMHMTNDPGDEATFMLIRHLPEMIEQSLLSQMHDKRKPKRGRDELLPDGPTGPANRVT